MTIEVKGDPQTFPTDDKLASRDPASRKLLPSSLCDFVWLLIVLFAQKQKMLSSPDKRSSKLSCYWHKTPRQLRRWRMKSAVMVVAKVQGFSIASPRQRAEPDSATPQSPAKRSPQKLPSAASSSPLSPRYGSARSCPRSFSPSHHSTVLM